MSTIDQFLAHPETSATAMTPVRRRSLRAAGMLTAAVATSTVWLIGTGLGATFTLTSSGKSVVINLPAVIGFTLWFAALGWAALALLEHYTRSAATIWTRLAVGVLAVSFAPIFLEHGTAGTRSALVLIHLSVAAIMVPALRYTARR